MEGPSNSTEYYAEQYALRYTLHLLACGYSLALAAADASHHLISYQGL